MCISITEHLKNNALEANLQLYRDLHYPLWLLVHRQYPTNNTNDYDARHKCAFIIKKSSQIESMQVLEHLHQHLALQTVLGLLEIQ